MSDRANLSLHGAHLLRDRVARVAERVGRRGRPRARFLAEQRTRTRATLVPTLAAVAAVTGCVAALELFSGADGDRAASIAQACVAIAVGAAALAAPLTRKSAPALLAVAAGGLGVAMLGWGLVVRLSGGPASPWLLVLPVIVGAAVAIVPLPPRLAYALEIGRASCRE